MFTEPTLDPGRQLGILDVWLHNRSKDPVSVVSATSYGSGINSVVIISDTRAAPSGPNDTQVPVSSYCTDPPVSAIQGNIPCAVQILTGLRGAVIAPGSFARLWQILTARKVGAYAVRGVASPR